jgi:hypothetical protein
MILKTIDGCAFIAIAQGKREQLFTLAEFTAAQHAELARIATEHADALAAAHNAQTALDAALLQGAPSKILRDVLAEAEAAVDVFQQSAAACHQRIEQVTALFDQREAAQIQADDAAKLSAVLDPIDVTLKELAL